MLFLKSEKGIAASQVVDVRRLSPAADVSAVFSCRKKLVKTTVLVPVAKEGEVQPLTMPKNLAKTVTILVKDRKDSKGFIQQITVQDLTPEHLDNCEVYVVEKIFQPKTTVKLVEAKATRKTAPKSPAKS